MAGRTYEALMARLLDCIPTKHTSVRQLSWKAGISRMTVTKYVRLIAYVQNSPRIRLETVGMRVLVRRENGNRTNTADR